MVTVPVISSYVLQGLPAFVRDELGEKALRRANRAAAVDLELIEGRNCFIPQQAVVSFANAIGREAGEAPIRWVKRSTAVSRRSAITARATGCR